MNTDRRNTAISFLNAGVQAAQDPKKDPRVMDHAFTMLSSAIHADPTFGQGFFQVGNALSDMKYWAGAVAAWRRALECENTEQEKAKILCNLGWGLHDLGRIEESYACSSRSIEIDQSLAYAWLNLGRTHIAMGNTLTAAGCAQRAYDLAPEDHACEMALAFALLFDRQWAKGLKHFESRFPYKLTNYAHYPYPKWRGEEGKTIFLVADQGLGDTLSFSRFVPRVCKRARYVHACVQQELLKVFHHAFAKIDNLNIVPSPTPFPEADAWSTFVSMPWALGLTDDEIEAQEGIDMPMYRMARHTVGSWKVPDRKLHIGIAFAGSPLNDIDVHRSVPVQQFLDLYEVPGIQLYSLQKDARSSEIHTTGCGAFIRDLSNYISDVCDTVSILAELDLVVTIESALGHIAGAIGKETWIPYSYMGRDYRLGVDGKKPLWYPNHRAFRQGPDMRWGPVFKDIGLALDQRIRRAERETARKNAEPFRELQVGFANQP